MKPPRDERISSRELLKKSISRSTDLPAPHWVFRLFFAKGVHCTFRAQTKVDGLKERKETL
jgi:hypothetical protein